jgi:Pentapeptide repeats (8 copies)
MRSIVQRVVALLRCHSLLTLGSLVLLAVVVIWWIFSAPIAQWLRSAQSVGVMTLLQHHLLAVGIIGSCLLICALIWLPKWQASRVQDVKDRLTVENAARQTLAQIIGGAVLIVGLFFTWANLKITQETATKSQEITREGQITDRFTKATDQLGATDQAGRKKLAVRLGGIYALERIARDSPKDHGPIMEVLTAYVREHAPLPSTPSKDTPPPQDHPTPEGQPAAAPQLPPEPAADIQAVLTVLRRRERTHETAEHSLNLMNTDLSRASFYRVHLKGAYLANMVLILASFKEAHLEGAYFYYSHLQRANLEGAHLEGAHLEGANFRDTILEGADLTGASLEGARNLTVQQLSGVRSLYNAHIDPPLLEQIRQQYPHLLEKPQN